GDHSAHAQKVVLGTGKANSSFPSFVSRGGDPMIVDTVIARCDRLVGKSEKLEISAVRGSAHQETIEPPEIPALDELHRSVPWPIIELILDHDHHDGPMPSEVKPRIGE
ncbi:MAG: hypothetical protein J2P57_20280, partial [Acidimicrobiaceae bacterium]|nr:hypothetical protein [Acidimicrobiaceae bacterium]